MAIIKPEQLLPNRKKPDLKLLLTTMGDRLRDFGMGYPLPTTLNHGNENFPMFRINQTAHNCITRQHIDQITDSFAVMTMADIHDMDDIKEPLKEGDLIDKKLTMINVDRFLMHVTNMLEQATSTRDKDPAYLSGKFGNHTGFKLSEAWDNLATSRRKPKHTIPGEFGSESIRELCSLVAQCHLLIRSEPLSAIIKHHVAALPQPVEVVPQSEETSSARSEPKLASVLEAAAQEAPAEPAQQPTEPSRQQVVQIPLRPKAMGA